MPQYEITKVQDVGRSVVLYATLLDGDCERIFTIKDATIQPYPGDTMHFSNIAAKDASGEPVGGKGHIEMDGNAFPYRRVSYSEFEQRF